MAEQRLIDANNYKEALKALPDIAGKKAAIELLGMMPTIDPNELPVVKQLREELDKERKICDDLQADLVRTALERDAACKELLEWALLLDAECICCAHQIERVVCPGCEKGSQWEWRGPQKEE